MSGKPQPCTAWSRPWPRSSSCPRGAFTRFRVAIKGWGAKQPESEACPRPLLTNFVTKPRFPGLRNVTLQPRLSPRGRAVVDGGSGVGGGRGGPGVSAHVWPQRPGATQSPSTRAAVGAVGAGPSQLCGTRSPASRVLSWGPSGARFPRQHGQPPRARPLRGARRAGGQAAAPAPRPLPLVQLHSGAELGAPPRPPFSGRAAARRCRVARSTGRAPAVLGA